MIIDTKKDDDSSNLMMDTLSELSGKDGQSFLGMRTCMDELQKILDAVTDIITIHDRDFNILMANKTFYEKFNISREELSGKKCYEIFHNTESCWHNCPLSKSILSLRPESVEVDDLNMGGNFLVSSFPIKDERGNIHKYILLTRDITLQKKLEKHLVVNSDKLEKVHKELEDFITIISHDLQGRLFSIEGYTNMLFMLCANTFEEKEKLYINNIISCTKTMSQRIHEIMETLKLGRITYNMKYNDSGEIIKSVIKELEGRIKVNNIKTVIQDNLPTILCDKQRLKDVFSNLINNAIKYMGNDTLPFSKSGEGKCIIIGYDKLGDYYKFFVIDNGIGIKADYHERIFEMFRRLNDIHTEGSGVGLAIVKKIVEQHNGSIWVESPVNNGKGSIFSFTIPVNR